MQKNDTSCWHHLYQTMKLFNSSVNAYDQVLKAFNGWKPQTRVKQILLRLLLQLIIKLKPKAVER